jgi:molybdopterin converting factor small subunit
MAVRVRFFGATANLTGKREESVEPGENRVASAIFNQMLAKYPQLSSHRLLFSINQQYSNGDELVKDGDEIAIFTAVSGG